MRSSRSKTARKINSGNKTKYFTKTRLTAIASFVVIALMSTAAFSSTAAAGSLSDFLFGSASLRDLLSGVTAAAKPESAARPVSLEADAASQSAARSGHTAIDLGGGRVLLVGGDNKGTAEIYDINSGTSFPTGDLNAARSGHTATLLSDGRVLITGGFSDGKALATTEIYDGGAFLAGPNLTAARAGHTATVLSDGRILLVGGDSKGSVEILDAAAQSSQKIKSRLIASRAFHSAELLGNGSVLIVGGSSKDGSPVYSGEILNLETMEFSEVSRPLHSARIRPVLNKLPDGKVQIIGGNDEGSMEMYTPDGNYFNAFAHVIPGRNPRESKALKNRGAKAEGGYVLENSGASRAETEVLKTETRAALINTGEAADSLLNRSDYALVKLAGLNKVLVSGGKNSQGETLKSSMTFAESEATVTTDKLDYLPGETVIISGAGWEPGETVKLTLVRDRVPTGDGQTDTIILEAVADADGKFVNRDYSTTDEDFGASFVLTAVGQSSGKTAQTTFTDGRTLTSVTLNGGSSVTVAPGATITANAFVTTTSAGGNSDWKSTAWRIANTAPGTLTCVNTGNYSGNNQNHSEAFSITAPTTPGTYNAYFIAYQDDTCSLNASNTITLTNAVTVANPEAVSATWNESTLTISANATGLNTAQTYRIDFVPPTGTGGNTVQSTNFTGSTTAARSTVLSLIRVGNWTLNLVRTSDSATVATNTVSVTATNRKLGFTTIPSATDANVESGAFQVQRQNGAGIGYIDGTSLTVTESSTSSTGQFRQTSGGPANNSGTIGTTSSQRSFYYIDSTPGTYTITASAAGHTDATTSYTVNSVAVATTLAVSPASGTYGGTANLTATLTQTSGGAGVSGKTISFTLNGNSVGTAVTNSSGAATLNNASLNGINAGSHPNAVVASFAGDSGFLTSNGSNSLTVNQKTVTGSFTADNKVYDGNTNATILTRIVTPADIVGSDVVTLTGGTASFNNKNVGNGKTVTGTGFSLGGANAGNYVLGTVATTTANITAATVTGSFTANNKTYDGTTAATIASRSITGGVIGSEDVSLTGGTATFDTKDAGTGKTVTGTGFTLAGADAGNYVLGTVATALADITPKTLIVTATGVDKVYDGLTSATVTLSDDRISGDVFTASYTSAAFADKHVANAKAISVSGISITGADAGNYSPNTTANASANITPRTLNVTATGINKVYDGTTAATVNLNGDGISGDVVTLSYTANFADKNVGTGKSVSVNAIAISGGADGGNYTLGNTTTSTTADITPKSVTASVTAADKTYDGSANATITGCQLTGVIEPDTTGCAASSTASDNQFDNANAGLNKTVTASNISLTNNASGNYALSSATAVTTANINKAAVTATAGGGSATYDGTAKSPSACSVTGAYTGDLTCANNPASVGPGAGTTTIAPVVNGTGLSNFDVNSVNGSFTINKASLTVTADNKGKSYDGTAFTAFTSTITGFVNNENSSVVSGSPGYSGNAVGAVNAGSYTITPTLGTLSAANYDFVSFVNGTLSISKAAVMATAGSGSSAYDGSTKTPSACVVSGAFTGDLTCANSPASVGPGAGTTSIAPVVGGTGLGNFEITSVPGSYTIEKAGSMTTVTCPAAVTYNGSAQTPCTVSVTGAGGLNLTPNPDYSNNVNAGNATASYTFAGGDNHNGSSDSKNFTIDPVQLTAAVDANNKPYDTNNAATINGCTFTGVVSGDDVSCATSGYTASFDNKNVGTGKTVTALGLTKTGSDAGNYSFGGTGTGLADITAIPLTATVDANSKTYDGNANATINGCTFTGVLPNDVVNCVTTGYSASFNDKNVSSGKPVSASGLGKSGTDAGNYSFNGNGSGSANITVRTLTVTATAENKVFDGTTAATATLLDNRVAGDNLTVSYTSANFDTANVGINKQVTVSGISISGGTDAGNYTLGNTTTVTTANITAAGTSTNVTVNSSPVQYSDQVTFTANITASNTALNGSIAGTVQFYIGNAAQGSPAAVTAGTSGGTASITFNNQLAPNNYNVSAVFTSTNANLSGSGFVPGSSNLTVTREDARSTYTGLDFITTSSAGATSANVTLSATIQDITAVNSTSDPHAGDIRNARVSFVNRDAGNQALCSALVPSLVNASDTKTGTVGCTVNLGVGNTGATPYRIGIIVNHYYTRDNPDDDTVVTVAQPVNSMITGGGYIVNAASAGVYAGSLGLKTNFGFNVKYNKNMTNLQGNVNVIIRASDGRVYQIKSNAMNSLQTKLITGEASFESKANLTDVTDSNNPVSLGGNLTFQMVMKDNGEPGTKDLIGFTLRNSSGALLFSSNWDGIKTIQQNLRGGNLAVR
jgi:hypothetical protein